MTNFLDSTNRPSSSTAAKSDSNLKAPISNSNENHIGNVELEEVIALSDSEYSDTDSLSQIMCLMKLLNDSSGTCGKLFFKRLSSLYDF